MKNPLAGFTVAEVMIFLTVSAILFISAVSVFGGRSQQTQFTQAMQDLQSQFRAYANQVRTSYLAGLGDYNCSVSATLSNGSVRPLLTKTANPAPNQDCVLLGRSIQAIPDTDTLYSYPVFGLRNKWQASVNTGAFPTSIEEAAPEPAIDSLDPDIWNWFMVEPYQLSGGFKVSKTTLSTGGVNSTPQDLLSLYSSLQNNNTSGNEINAYSQSIGFSSGDEQSKKLHDCIESTGCDFTNPINNSIWKLCVTDGNKFGELQVRDTPTGITTSLNMDRCT
jgi:Tfp pilus assembly protein PilE